MRQLGRIEGEGELTAVAGLLAVRDLLRGVGVVDGGRFLGTPVLHNQHISPGAGLERKAGYARR